MPAPDSPFAVGNQPWDIAVGDVNKDGKLDMITANMDNDTKMDLVLRGPNSRIMVLLGDGNGSFNPAAGSPLAVGAEPLSLAVADINMDGKLDILAANRGSNNVTLLLGRK